MAHAQSSVQSLSRVQLFATLWTAARQASLSITKIAHAQKQLRIKHPTISWLSALLDIHLWPLSLKARRSAILQFPSSPS